MPTVSLLHPPYLKLANDKIIWADLTDASLGLALHSTIIHRNSPLLIVTTDTLQSERLHDELKFFQDGHDYPILLLPDWETLPYDFFSPHQEIISARLATLYQIPHLKQGAIIVSIASLMQRLCPTQYLSSTTFLLKIGDKLDLNTIRLQLEKAGYHAVNQVKEPGEFAIRGSILDLFPTGEPLPFRIDLFDNEIDSIRTFAVDNQRSLDKINHIELLPAKEFPLNQDGIENFRKAWRARFAGNPLNCSLYQEISEGICSPGIEYYLPLFFKETATLFDYLPTDTAVVLSNKLHDKALEFWQEIQARFDQLGHDITRPILAPTELYLSVPDVFACMNQHATIKLQSSVGETAYNFAVDQLPELFINRKSKNPLQQLETFLKSFKGRILFCAETSGRREVLLELFRTIQLVPQLVTTWSEFLTNDIPYGLVVAPLEQGLFLKNPPLALIAESHLFGQRIMQRRRRKETTQDPDLIVKDLTELQVGAPIVHLDHGVGRYLGLQILEVGEQLTEFLAIEYADSAKLYVPIASLHLISRYSGVDTEHAPLHKLGSEHWQRSKQKAAEKAHDVAAELLAMYAEREASEAHACQTLSDYDKFADDFPFEETPDQQRAILQVVEDLQKNKPMDRLVCGDVGFGKTEVAMRAAFIAVQNNQQVVILVPTTLLAQQHYQNFQDRFADWPVQIGLLSRFKTAKEQEITLSKLAEGKIDIIIGTHKLLSADVKFKSLGLLIVDEEHLFGVKQKEKIKALRHNVHILTMTATPIPRTLNMAFAGIRDLSIIATPPARRLAVKTFIQEFKKPLLHEAILREILRGGQVYYVHNDVKTIDKAARELSELIPEAQPRVAHGQMRESLLEQIMADFYHRRFNVLVCSTIIESGIDIPSANTIIINRADKFGLAQLHQLRGRVGRSHHQAYAYLLIPSLKLISNDAKKRLDAIAAYEDLGIGFTLATHDLEIRGAGELLGENQSGEMHDVGFSLYMDLLSRAVASLKAGKKPSDELSSNNIAEIDLQIPALIPDTYLHDVHLRLQFYKRIASAKSPNELDELQVEMIDRFGLLPDALKNLFAVSVLKQQATALGIKKLETYSKGGKIIFIDKPNVDPLRIIQLVQQQNRQFKLDGSTTLRFSLPEHNRKDRIAMVQTILEKLS